MNHPMMSELLARERIERFRREAEIARRSRVAEIACRSRVAEIARRSRVARKARSRRPISRPKVHPAWIALAVAVVYVVWGSGPGL